MAGLLNGEQAEARGVTPPQLLGLWRVQGLARRLTLTCDRLAGVFQGRSHGGSTPRLDSCCPAVGAGGYEPDALGRPGNTGPDLLAIRIRCLVTNGLMLLEIGGGRRTPKYVVILLKPAKPQNRKTALPSCILDKGGTCVAAT